MAKLEPCPFCGEDVFSIKQLHQREVVHCVRCGIQMGVTRWNTRPLENNLKDATGILLKIIDHHGTREMKAHAREILIARKIIEGMSPD